MMKNKESFYENDEDVSAQFLNTMEDIVQNINVAQGSPYIGRTGKPHPVYDVTLSGTSTVRTRTYRFAVFRDYHQNKVEKSGFNVNSKFPKTYTKSSFGIKMTTKEIEQRCKDLDIYMREIYDRRNEWTPKLKEATLLLLKLDENNVFGDRNRAPTMTDTIRAAQQEVNNERMAAEQAAKDASWNRQEASNNMLSKAKLVHKKHPANRTARAVVGLEAWYKELGDEKMKRLIACVKSGLDHPSSELGCYAMQPSDYETLGNFFDRVCNDYHNNAAGDKVHQTSWEVKADNLPENGQLDLRNMGLTEPLSMRVRVGRNLTSFPLPGAMTKEDRIKFELTMSKAFDQLIKDARFGGRVYSLTPHTDWFNVTGVANNPNFMSQEKYEELVKAHVMFKDMSNDPYLKSAGIASDWPAGRGCYQSSDGGFIIWFGEEDQLRIMCMGKGFVLNDVFDRLKMALEVVESIDGIEFATSTKYGYVTSCPSNLGTGMRASVHLKLPNLTNDGTDLKVKEIAKKFNLSVRGIGGEHTPIGEDGTVDISPSQRLFISEGEIISQLYQGISILLKSEIDAAPPKNRAFLFLKPHANTQEVLSIVKEHLELCGVDLLSSGFISNEDINKNQYIDQHYYSIASKATILKPKELIISNEKFEKIFNISWYDVLEKGNVYNALDACKYLDVSPEEMDILWSQCKKKKLLLKISGGFYCGLINWIPNKEPIYVFNGFYMAMRDKYINSSSKGITWLNVEWDSNTMSWSDFRSGLLGPTDPNEASSNSLRGMIKEAWSKLNLPNEPDVGDNGVHGSASPFEAMVERLNWLQNIPTSSSSSLSNNENDDSTGNMKLTIENDPFGSKLIQLGIPKKIIEDWSKDPQVSLGNGTYMSLFDCLEDLNASECLDKCQELYEVQSVLDGSIIIRVNEGDYNSKLINGSDKRYAILLDNHHHSSSLSKTMNFKPKYQPSSNSSSSSNMKCSSRKLLQVIKGSDRSNDLSIITREQDYKNAKKISLLKLQKLNGFSKIEEICEKRLNNEQVEYMIKWVGYADLVWLTSEDLFLYENAEELVNQYEASVQENSILEKLADDAAEKATLKSQAGGSTLSGGASGGGGGGASGMSGGGMSDEFKEAIESGIVLVKFNRKGVATKRTISMISADDYILTWRPTAKEGIAGRMVRATLKGGENIDLRTLKDVRCGEHPDPESVPNKDGKRKWGTPTLRTYVKKNNHGVQMLAAGITCCLVFNGRSLDFGLDSTAQRDFIVEGFKALHAQIQANNSIAEE
jgi:creatine kinase